MSAKISGKVWELDLEPTEKLVLLALADHADHEGNNVRPGNDLLVAKTGLSQQTISAKITKFIEMGILEPTKDERGRGVVREFSIEPERAERKQFFIEREERKLQAARSFKKAESYKQGVASETKRYNLTEQKVQSDNEKVQSDKIAYKEENRQEPSKEGEAPPVLVEVTPDGITDALEEIYPGHAPNFRTIRQMYDLAVKLNATAADVRKFPAWLETNHPKKADGPFAFLDLFNKSLPEKRPSQVHGNSGAVKAPADYAQFYKDAA